MNLHRVMCSNLWPVAAFATVAVWLVLVNVGNLPFGLYPSPEYYRFLVQLDGIAHLTMALAMSSLLVQLWSRHRTVGFMLFLMFAWEVFEFLVQDHLAGGLVTQRIEYYSDMLDDMALGITGMLIGVFAGSRTDDD